jgi:hypothetical protein
VPLNPSATGTYGDGNTPYVLGAKPVHLNADGAFDWMYQTGDVDRVKLLSGSVGIVAGYSGESNIYFLEAGVAMLEFNGWKNDVNPCVTAVMHDYTFTVHGAEVGATDTVWIAGNFKAPYPNWEFMPMTRVDNSTFTITLNGVAEGAEYAYLLNNNWDTKQADADCAGIGNLVTGTSAAISDDITNWLGFGTCYVPPVPHDYTFTVTVPEGTPDTAKVRIVGNFADANWSVDTTTMELTKGGDGKYTITLNGVLEGTDYKYVINGTWDNEELSAKEDGADCAKGIDNRKTGAETAIADVVANWKGITATKCPDE